MKHSLIKIHFYLLLVGIIFCLTTYSQTNTNFSYLKKCFKNSSIDSFKNQIDGIGEVMFYSVTSDSVESMLNYYFIPKDKQSKKRRKLAELAANRQIETWKNNSNIILNKKYETDFASFIDLRLHMIIENIYLQVIIVCEDNMVYEIDCFRDENDKAFFDDQTRKIQKKNCL
jgi:hypothetical protein